MPEVYTIPLSKIIHELQLETAFLPKSADDILIQSRDVVRPGMELNGYHEYFDPNRIAVLGRAEMYMLESLKPERRAVALDSYLSLKPPAVIVSRGIDPGKDFMEIAETYHVPVLRTTESTSNVVASLVAYLNVELAPRITRHGVLVEVYGEGILLVGDSGVGKSETAIELIKRGHRLIADDAVEIRRVSSKSLVGQSPENIRHSSSCAASVSSTPVAFSVWAPLSCRRKSTCASTWRSGTRRRSTTAWAWTANTRKFSASRCR